jgi:phage tail-like protein
MQTQFPQDHVLLNGQTGWQASYLAGTLIDDCSGALELAPAPGPPKPVLSGLALPVSLALDSDNRIYLLDRSEGLIKRYDPCEGQFVPLPCVGGPGQGPRRLQDTTAIAIQRNTLLTAEAGNRRVQVFALDSLALRAVWGPLSVTTDADGVHVKRVTLTASPDPSVWVPVALAMACDGRSYVTDSANGLIHVFDARGCWRTAYAVADPAQIVLDGEGKLYIARQGTDEITVLAPDGTPLPPIVPPNRPRSLAPSPIAIDSQGRIHLSNPIQGTVDVICRAEGGYTVKQTYSSGNAVELVFDSDGNLVVADGSGQVNVLGANELYELSGTYYSSGLDSRVYNCVWDRVWLRATIPAGCRVFIETLASEAEKTNAELISLPDSRWTRAGTLSRTGDGDWDCLIQSEPGRYLFLRLILEGEGLDTPSIFEARAFLPRKTSLQYLPATFSADVEGRRFLEGLLSITDTILLRGIGGRISAMAALFDPASSPSGDAGEPDFLSWLAGWLGLALEYHWPVGKRRELVAAAHRLYRLRGTPEGLREHLRIYSGHEPSILENFKLRKWVVLGASRLGGRSNLWSADIVNRLELNQHAELDSVQLIDSQDPLRDPFWVTAHRFSVFVPAPESAGDSERAQLQKIVDLAKPAHTEAKVHLLKPRFRIGYQSFVGVDTVLGGCVAAMQIGGRKLSYDAVLGSARRTRGIQIGIHSRVGKDTRLD